MQPFYQDKKISRISAFSTLDYAPHLHNALEIGWLKEGSGTLAIEGKAFHLQAGDLFIIFPHFIHTFFDSNEAKGFLAILTWEDLNPFHCVLADRMPVNPVLPMGSWEQTRLQDIFPLAAEESGSCGEEVKKGYCRILAGKFLSLFPTTQRQEHSKSTLHEILAYLSAHSGENVSRKALARALGISESTISHVFSETFHTSLPAYCNGMRLEEATRLLEESDLSVTQIANIAGFGSIRSFNRAFRLAHGLSPSEYRQKRKTVPSN
ncbi:MAG: helix-turn-helix transcriptional regulator [Clostridia bacterium]|nr:helix-turn-helix transcriptional regulator [Clostridia bacterium]